MAAARELVYTGSLRQEYYVDWYQASLVDNALGEISQTP